MRYDDIPLGIGQSGDDTADDDAAAASTFIADRDFGLLNGDGSSDSDGGVRVH